MGRERQCFSCGYNLEGVQSGDRCPECGLPAYDKFEVMDPMAVRRRRVAVLAAVIVIVVVVVSCGTCGLLIR